MSKFRHSRKASSSIHGHYPPHFSAAGSPYISLPSHLISVSVMTRCHPVVILASSGLGSLLIEKTRRLAGSIRTTSSLSSFVDS